MNYKSQVTVAPFLQWPSLLVDPAPFPPSIVWSKIIEGSREDCNSRQALRQKEGNFDITGGRGAKVV